ncbi:MAG: pseudouridine synthase [Bacteroidota bacterium]
MPRPTKNNRSQKQESGPRTSWKKPDGTPLRKRRGDYFPDEEISKRSAPKKRYGSDDGGTTDSNRSTKFGNSDRNEKGPDARKRFGTDERKKGPFEKPKFGGRDRDQQRPTRERRTSQNDEGGEAGTERPAYGDRNENRGSSKGRSTYGDRSENRGSSKGRSTFRDRNEGRGSGKSRSTYGGRSEGRDSNKDRQTYSDRSESRDTDNDQPSHGDRSESRDSGKDRPTYGDRNQKPFEKRGESKREGGYERSSSRTSRSGDKPSWKKRERYDRIEHSENMGSRFEKGSRYKKRDQTKRKDRPAPSKTFQPDAAGAIRLNRFIANAGICSRREADELIEAGVIAINGQVVTELGSKVLPGDEVRFHDRVLRTERMVYVLLNKPKDYITTTDDPDDRKTVMNLVHDACKERIFPVGRLDRNTTGLLLLTNDGDLTKKLTHPSSNIAKVYQVELDKNLTLADMKTASEGVELEDGVVAFDNIEYASPDDKKIVGVELHSGKNRIVRRIFEELGYDVKKLDRTIFAGLTKKDLPRGRWRFLTELEVSGLKMLKGGSGRSGERRR